MAAVNSEVSFSSNLSSIFGRFHDNSPIDQTEISVSSILHPPLPATNLYFMSIMRIHEVKTGPFHEHSSQLHSIAVGVPNWSKVNSGLFKMYEARCYYPLASHRTLTYFVTGGGAGKARGRPTHSPRRLIGIRRRHTTYKV